MKKFLNKFLFLDADPIIKLGRNSIFEAKDALPLNYKINPRTDYFSEADLIYNKGPYRYLFSTIQTSSKEIYQSYFWYFVSSCLTLLSPYLIHEFITSISVGYFDLNLTKTLFLGITLGLCGIFSGLLLQQYFYHALMAYQILVNMINKKIFNHSLKLSTEGRQKNLIGDIVNFLASDSESVADFTFIFGDLASNAVLLIGIIVMLFNYLGSSTLYALIAMAILVPFTKYLAKKFTVLEDEMMSFRDKRVTLITQILNSIRIVKYFSLENSFSKEVLDIRNQELDKRKKLAKSEVLSGLIFVSMNSVVLLVALTAHYLRGQEINAALIFTCVSLFSLLDGPIGELSHLISRLTNAKVGAKRILDFLNSDTLLPSENNNQTSNDIKINQYSAKYTSNQNDIIKNINFTFSPNKSYAIVGPVGAGKTTLLHAILGELKSTQGIIEMNREARISFVPQDAFILNDNLKSNITFGNQPTEQEITEALYTSALDRDLFGQHLNLNTEIGEKGLNLSGGQKQRVSLARAVINNPEIILLDDPLSAVDHTTENLICDRLIFGKLNNILRIVVTHRLNHLQRFDEIIFLNDGTIIDHGSFENLHNRCKEFQIFYEAHSKSHDDLEITKTDSKDKNNDEGSRITIEEDREKGAVKSSLYFEYIKSLGGNGPYRNLILITLFVGAIILALIPLSQKYWLSYITNAKNNISILNGLYIYGLLSISVLILGFLNNFFWLDRGIKASQYLHDKMLSSILRAPIRFFDSTPIGRIIQRFSRDIESVDIHLQWSFISVVNCILQVCISLGLILSIMPYMIFAIIPVFIIYYKVQNDYRKSAREAKRLDSIARSPRYAHFKETLQGLIVIRAFKKEKWFTENFLNHLSFGQQMFYNHYMLNRWFSSRIPIIAGIISIMTAISISILAFKNIMQPGLAGLITVYSLSFWGYLNWGVRVFSDIESRMTSIERLKFFANIEPEKDTKADAYTHIESNWPNEGGIKFNNVSTRYAAHLPLVLNHINFQVRPKTKVGIIGKTGSGKSTLFQCLFRFIDLESGEIDIDGLNIQRVPLSRLRKSMAIIPQDPSLFIGTIRSNLDRYNEYTDQEIDEALINCGLYDYVYSLPEKLNFTIHEGGNNLSQGQRQLLCLGRALLTKAKIIVMDEATASVDVKTDELLQKIIDEKLKDVTLLIIAHRLGTIKNCDLIIEISEGNSKIIKDY